MNYFSSEKFSGSTTREPRPLRHGPRRPPPSRSSSPGYKQIVREETGEPVPGGPARAALGCHRRGVRQLDERPGRDLSRLNDVPRAMGTAVNVQSMVFGNMGDDSPRAWPSPATPRPASTRSYGEFLINAQGEDVVAGIRTPQPLTRAGEERPDGAPDEEAMPEAFAELDASSSGSSGTTATCRTSSSPSSRASCTSCRPAAASAPPRPR